MYVYVGGRVVVPGGSPLLVLTGLPCPLPPGMLAVGGGGLGCRQYGPTMNAAALPHNTGREEGVGRTMTAEERSLPVDIAAPAKLASRPWCTFLEHTNS
jgi:hypothetical protein